MLLCFVGCGEEIDNNPTGDQGETTSNTENNADNPNEGNESEGDTTDPDQSETGYPFDLAFIEENGIEYIWEQLDEDTRYNLGEMMNAIKRVDVYCSLSVGLPQEELTDFLELVSNASIAYTYEGNRFKGHKDESGKIVGITLSYEGIDYTEDGIARTETLLAAVDEIVRGMPNGTDYEKLKYLHDALVLRCDYNTDALSPFTAYGAIVEGRATCQGYADAMHLLLSRAGFETVYTTGIGDSATVKHKWNYVKTSDGNWYIIDSTWDDPEGKADKLYIGYEYFMISNEMLLSDHQEIFISPYYTLPEANSMDLSYYVMSGYQASSYDEVKEIIKKQALEIVPKGEKYIYLRCDSSELFNEANEKLFSGDYEMQTILLDVMAETGVENLITNSWTKVVKEGPCSITITLKYE